MRARSSLALALAALAAAAPGVAAAQTKITGFALDAYDPAVPVDAFFGVPSPAIGGHLEFRAAAMFDYALRPFKYNLPGQGTTFVVGSQGFLRVDASFALWDRLLVSVDMPFAVVNSGTEPKDPRFDFHAPSKPAVGDLRIGLRGRIYGDFRDPFQIGLGANLHAPTGSADAYAGQGSVRGNFQLLLGGRAGTGVGFVWSAAGGVMVRGGDVPLANFGAGAGLVIGEDRFQVGPEIYGSAAIGGARHELAKALANADVGSPAEIEVLGGAKVRIVSGLFLGAAAGSGLISSIGSPTLRVIGTLGWTPLPGPAKAKGPAGDRDGDGIADDVDACPDEKGELQADHTKDGCPIPDKDHDGVLDVDDACPTEPGEKSPDATKNGCPLDTDEDGIADAVDACPKVPGSKSSDPKKNGCPGDRDGDGIADAEDACPDSPGVRSSNPKINGCSDDPDGDGIKGAADACPNEKGPADPDPKQNGCPKFVRVDNNEITIAVQIQFLSNGRRKNETVSPVSEALLKEIRDAIMTHPEILKVEVQGHTDDAGSEEYNQRLSQERAEAVRNWLIAAGVPADKLVAKGYGMWKPLGDNRIRLGRVANRRVQFVILERRK